jgi:hypothetical protein
VGTRLSPLSVVLGLLLALGGCRTPLVDTTIVNQGPALHVVEFDYPSASFGTDLIPAGGQYHYRFRIQESGPLTLHFEDNEGHDHTAAGPVVHQGQQGSLVVTIKGSNSPLQWDLKLTPAKQ